MKKIIMIFILLISSSALAQEDCSSKINDFMKDTGYKAVTASPCKVWLINGLFKIPQGEGLQGMMLIGHEDDIVVVGTVVRPKATQSLSEQKLLNLLQLNNDLDYVKIGIDKDGDLFVRAELRVKNLVSEDFSSTIKYVIKGGNKAYEMLNK